MSPGIHARLEIIPKYAFQLAFVKGITHGPGFTRGFFSPRNGHSRTISIERETLRLNCVIDGEAYGKKSKHDKPASG
jgi:hypothetical protein